MLNGIGALQPFEAMPRTADALRRIRSKAIEGGRQVPMALADDDAGSPLTGAYAHLPLQLGGHAHGGLDSPVPCPWWPVPSCSWAPDFDEPMVWCAVAHPEAFRL